MSLRGKRKFDIYGFDLVKCIRFAVIKVNESRKMKKLMISAVLAGAVAVGLEAAPDTAVTQADLKALIERISKLEAENKAQAEKIALLEKQSTVETNKDTDKAKMPEGVKVCSSADIPHEEGTTVSDSGRVFTASNGKSYYLADKFAGIFEPLSESGLMITPYGYICAEAAYNSHSTEVDVYTDFVRPKSDKSYKDGTATLSVQDSILGIRFASPEEYNGWMFNGKAEFDLAGDHANDYAFHWRHLYFEAEKDGWGILFGQTWHLWKMVSPQEIDGAWLENTGYPYRRSPQIRVTKKIDFDDESSLEIRAGIVKNGPGMGGDRDDDGNQDNSASKWALLEGAVIYDREASWDEGRRWLLGLAGQYGKDRSSRWSGYDGNGDPVYKGKYDEYESKMLMVAASIPFLEKFTLTGQFFAGENLGGIQAGVGQRVGFGAIGEKGEGVGTTGGFMDLSYALTDDLTFAGGYGFDNPRNKEAINADGILHNDRAYINAIYTLTKNMSFGLEYARLSTQWHNKGTANDDRIQFTAFYNF